MTLRPLLPSIMLFLVAFGLDRLHKHLQVAADCIGLGMSKCAAIPATYVPISMSNWRGGEIVQVTDFFDYVLIWNTGISYGLFDSLPVWTLGILMIVAMAALAIWWRRADSPLIRAGLALCLGGALSNGIDRAIYGAVADFFHFHWGNWSFYIFNIADVALTLGVVVLLLDVVGFSQRKTT